MGRAPRGLGFALGMILMAAGCASWYISRGDDAAAAGDWDRAYQQYQSALNTDPENAEAARRLDEARERAAASHLERGQAALATHRHDLAISELQRSLWYRPDPHVEALVERARVAKRLVYADRAVVSGAKAESDGDLLSAREFYVRAHTLDPTRGDARLGAARVEKQIRQASDFAQQAQIALTRGDLANADRLARRALSIHPRDGVAESVAELIAREEEAREMDEEARAVASAGDVLRAVELSERAISLRATPARTAVHEEFKRLTSEHFAALGDSAITARRWDQAIDSYERARSYSALNPERERRLIDARYESEIARAMEAEVGGDPHVAIEHYQNADEIHPSPMLKRKIAELKEGLGRFVAEYVPPSDPAYWNMYTSLRDSRMLEQLAAELNRGLSLPSTVTLATESCGQPNAFYNPQYHRISLCYELLVDLAARFAGHSNQDTLVAGAFTFVFFHELGHALIDVLDLPTTGREEDAVDQLSVLMLLESDDHEFGESATAAAASWFLRRTGTQGFTASDYADEHGLGPQRFYNILCWIYGHDVARHASLVTQGHLPAQRARRCASEYHQIRSSWERLLQPYERPSGKHE